MAFRELTLEGPPLPAHNPQVRALTAQIGAHVSWAQTADRTARTAPARKAFEDRFAAQVREEFPDLDDAEVATRAEHLKKAYYLRLSLASAQARKAKAASRKSGGA